MNIQFRWIVFFLRDCHHQLSLFAINQNCNLIFSTLNNLLLPSTQVGRFIQPNGFKLCLRFRSITSLLLKAVFPGNWKATPNTTNFTTFNNMTIFLGVIITNNQRLSFQKTRCVVSSFIGGQRTFTQRHIIFFCFAWCVRGMRGKTGIIVRITLYKRQVHYARYLFFELNAIESSGFPSPFCLYLLINGSLPFEMCI